MKISFKNINQVKYLSSLYFIVPGFISLVHTLIYSPEYYIRDIIILLVLSLPIIINRRLFFLFYGLLASIISLVICIVFIFNNSPSRIDISISMYLIGCILYLLGILAGLAMIYIGTYTKEKNTFKLV